MYLESDSLIADSAFQEDLPTLCAGGSSILPILKEGFDIAKGNVPRGGRGGDHQDRAHQGVRGLVVAEFI